MALQDLSQLQKHIYAQYMRNHAELGEQGTRDHLERGKQFDLSDTLKNGGVLVFPHTNVKDCGYQVAACVHACLDSGADQVLVISVLHAFTDDMELARRRVAGGGDFRQEPSWGIQGSGIPGPDNYRRDHVLISWHHFWDAETKRRGGKIPKVIERYPYLAGGHPEQLPGIEEVAAIAKDSVVVSTADAFHHGIGYGDTPETAFAPDEVGLRRAQSVIEDGIRILEAGDYWGYNQHCVQAKSDARDAGQVFRYLRGSMTGRVIDMTYTDASELYNQPPPTWVAGALTEWRLS